MRGAEPSVRLSPSHYGAPCALRGRFSRPLDLQAQVELQKTRSDCARGDESDIILFNWLPVSLILETYTVI